MKRRAKFWLEMLKERDQSKDQFLDERIILKLMLGKQKLRVGIRFMWLRLGSGAGFCEHGNEL
jgi:hypothetical protein